MLEEVEIGPRCRNGANCVEPSFAKMRHKSPEECFCPSPAGRHLNLPQVPIHSFPWRPASLNNLAS
jgi:hypothetical protein